jgi:acetyltransferase-like isoleucine patch superfamily enzyme
MMISPPIVRLLRRLRNSTVDREVSRTIEQIEGSRRPAHSRTAPNVVTLTIVDYGINNVLQIEPSARPDIGGTIVFKDSNNRVLIGKGCRAANVHFELASGSSIVIDDHCRLSDLFVFAHTDAVVRIGAGSNFEAGVRLLLHEPGSIVIGKDCLFASQVDMTISDMHSIVSAETGVRLNPAAGIALEDHVWIGIHSMVLKGARIGTGSIIGARSVVTRDVPENCIAVGAPAQVARKGVTWRTELLPIPSAPASANS